MHSLFEVIWRLNVQERPRSVKVRLETCMGVLVCLGMFYTLIFVEIDVRDPYNVYERIYIGYFRS